MVGDELVDGVEPDPTIPAATNAPTSAATAVIKPAIAVKTPEIELHNTLRVFYSPTIYNSPRCESLSIVGIDPMFNG